MAKQKVEVVWRHDYRPPAGVTVAGAASVLAKMLARGEDITTEGVLAAATPIESPIHNICEWDDEVAAHKERLRQCRQFLRGTLIVVGASQPQPLVHVPAVTVTESGRGGVYRLAEVLSSRPDEFGRALAEAHRYLQSARSRVDELERLIPPGDVRLDAVRIALQGFDAVQDALRVIQGKAPVG